MSKQWLWAISFCAVGALLLTGAMSKLSARVEAVSAPTRHFSLRSPGSEYSLTFLPQSGLRSETLFVIPYGKAKGQIYIHEEGLGEGEFWVLGPKTFRVLPNGNFAILGSTETGCALQIFDQQGRLVKYVPYKEPCGSGKTVIGADARSYTIYQILNDEFQLWLRGNSAVEEGNEKPAEDVSESPKLPNRLFVRNAEGEEDIVLRDKLQHDFYQTLIKHGFTDAGCDVVVTDQGEVYVELTSPLQPEGYSLYQVIRLHPNEEPKLLSGDELPGWIIPLPGGKLGYLAVDGQNAYKPTAVEIWNAARQQLGRFVIDEAFYKKGLLPRLADGTSREPVLVRRDRLALLFFEESRPDGSGDPARFVAFRPESLDSEVSARRYFLVVLEPSGKVVFEDTLYGGYFNRLCDADTKGNLYYLNFTKRGVEVKRVSFGP